MCDLDSEPTPVWNATSNHIWNTASGVSFMWLVAGLLGFENVDQLYISKPTVSGGNVGPAYRGETAPAPAPASAGAPTTADAGMGTGNPPVTIRPPTTASEFAELFRRLERMERNVRQANAHPVATRSTYGQAGGQFHRWSPDVSMFVPIDNRNVSGPFIAAVALAENDAIYNSGIEDLDYTQIINGFPVRCSKRVVLHFGTLVASHLCAEVVRLDGRRHYAHKSAAMTNNPEVVARWFKNLIRDGTGKLCFDTPKKFDPHTALRNGLEFGSSL